MNTPTTTNMNQGQEYFNSADGQTYTMKQQDPTGQGVIFVNKNTREEKLLPNDVVQQMQTNNVGASTLKPVMTRRVMADTDKKDIDELVEKVQDHILDDIDTEIEEIERQEKGIDGDIQEIIEDSQLFDELSSEMSDDKKDSDTKLPSSSELLKHVDHDIPTLASKVLPPKVESKHIPWMEYRKKITTMGQIERLKQQAEMLQKSGKDIAYSPDKRDVSDSGHSKVNNIPVSGPPKEKNMTIGLTEFPKDQKRDDSVGVQSGKGYDIPMKEMDENQVANREKFNNEQRQYMGAMTIRQLRELFNASNNKEVKSIEKGKGLQAEREPVKAEDNEQYSIEKKAIAQEVGLTSFSDIDLVPGQDESELEIPKDKPVEHKPIQKAPAIKEYVEPGIIQPASKEIKVFLDKFMEHYQRLQELKADLYSQLAPHQKEIADIQSKHMPGITTEEKLVKDALEMAYKAISMTEDSLVHYKDELWAAVSRIKTIQPAVTVAQIIEEAKLIDQHLAEQIEKLAKVVGKKGTSLVRERTLYEYPPSKSHVKRLKPESSLTITSVNTSIEELVDLVRGFIFLNSEIKDALTLLK